MRRLAVVIIYAAAAVGALGVATTAPAASGGWRVTTMSRSAGTPDAIACGAGSGCLLVGQLNPPAVTGSIERTFRAVTCSSFACTVVGEVITGLRAWRETGQRWTGMPFQPRVSGLYDGSLNSVSCVSSRDCLAAGNIDAHTHVDCAPNPVGLTVCETIVPVLERWDGSDWARQTTFPVPVVAQLAVPVGSEQGFSALDGVSCGAARWCVALGYVGSTTVGGSGLAIGPDFADTWNGAVWKLTILPSPPGSDPELISISCSSGRRVSRRRCVAVGSINLNGRPEPYAAEETNGLWSDASPRLVGTARLSSVSCMPDGECVAVGYRGRGAARQPLAERWRAGRWTAEPVQVPSDSRLRGGSELVSVSCTATAARNHALSAIDSCAAAGNYGHMTRSSLNVGWFVESRGPALPTQTSP